MSGDELRHTSSGRRFRTAVRWLYGICATIFIIFQAWARSIAIYNESDGWTGIRFFLGLLSRTARLPSGRISTFLEVSLCIK